MPTYSFDADMREMYKDVFTEENRVVPVSRLMSIKTFAKPNSRWNDDSSKIVEEVWKIQEPEVEMLDGGKQYNTPRETCLFSID
jgi:hypothetical protein